MNIDRHSSTVAKAGLTTGIIGSSLGALNMLGTGAGLLGGFKTNSSCSEDKLVNRYEAAQEAQISKLETEIALRDANKYTETQQLETYKYIDGRLREIEKQLCLQEVQNQKTSDSFQLVSERLQCCCDSINNKIANEVNARQCADNTLVNYMNATFYPKQVADVTTGSTTSVQVTYNPLPAMNYSCSCNCNCN